MADGLSTTLKGSVGYLGRESQIAHFGHRLSGLATLLFLIVHILDTSTVYFFPDLYEHAIAIYRSTPFMIGEMLLVVGVIAHGLNGLRIAIFDFYPNLWRSGRQKAWFYAEVVVGTLLAVPALYLMGRALYLHNICKCAPESTMSLEIPMWANVTIGAVLLLAVITVVRTGALRMPGEAAERSFDTWSWLFLRWSAILLLPLVWTHVLLTDVLFGIHRIDLDYVQIRWATFGWRAFDIALLGFAFAHGVIGLRSVIHDYVTDVVWVRRIDRLLLGMWLVITAIGAVAIVGGVRA